MDLEEVNGCTFSPLRKTKSSIKNKGSQSHRNLQDFYKEQIDFQNSVKNKIQNLQQKFEKDDYDYMREHQYKATQNSKRIYEEISKNKDDHIADVHARLYASQSA